MNSANLSGLIVKALVALCDQKDPMTEGIESISSLSVTRTLREDGEIKDIPFYSVKVRMKDGANFTVEIQ